MSTISSTMGPLPTSLLRAILRPSLNVSPIPLLQLHSRKASKVTLLDKLHRKQRKAVRQERLDSVARAAKMPSPTTPTSAPGRITGTPLSAQTTSPPAEDPQTVAATTEPSTSPSVLSSTAPKQRPYNITRTPSSQLPIYHLSKSGGNKHLTKLRKIEGDLNQLKTDIRTALGIEDYVIDRMGRKKENIAINWTTRQIVVKGWRRPELVKWAEGLGF